MEKKVKLRFNALWIIGLVFAGVGGLFVAIDLVVLLAAGEDAWLFGVIYLGVGGLFLVLGIIFLVTQWRKKQKAEQMIVAGRYVWGEIAAVNVNATITINHRHPYVLLVHYRDGYGTVHQFRSGNLYIPYAGGLLGKQVKVYYEDQTFRNYYVDLDHVLPQVVEH